MNLSKEERKLQEEQTMDQYRREVLREDADIPSLHNHYTRFLDKGSEDILYARNWNSEGAKQFPLGIHFKPQVKIYEPQFTEGVHAFPDIQKVKYDQLEDLYRRLTSNDYSLVNLNSPIFPDKTQKLIKVGTRGEIEYRNDLMQIVVAAAIVDANGNIVLLDNHSSSRHSDCVTLVQGHVDYDKSIYTTPAYHYLEEQMLREIQEEVGLVKEDIDTVEPMAIFYDNTNIVSTEHLILLFKVKTIIPLENLTLHNNEPEKHKIDILNFSGDRLAIKFSYDKLVAKTLTYLHATRNQESKK